MLICELIFSVDTQLFANDFFNRCVSCFNGLPEIPESVVSSKTVAEFQRRLSEVDLSSSLKYILITVLVICKWLC